MHRLQFKCDLRFVKVITLDPFPYIVNFTHHG